MGPRGGLEKGRGRPLQGVHQRQLDTVAHHRREPCQEPRPRRPSRRMLYASGRRGRDSRPAELHIAFTTRCNARTPIRGHPCQYMLYADACDDVLMYNLRIINTVRLPDGYVLLFTVL